MRWILLMLGEWEGFIREFRAVVPASETINTQDGPGIPPIGG